MRVQIIHHVDKDFTTEVIETITVRAGVVVSISYSGILKL